MNNITDSLNGFSFLFTNGNELNEQMSVVIGSDWSDADHIRVNQLSFFFNLEVVERGHSNIIQWLS